MSTADDPIQWLSRQSRSGTPALSRQAFQHQLDGIDAELVGTASLVADLIRPVSDGFLDGDTFAAGQAAVVDVEVDRRCLLLEESCFALLARQSPVAGDLRRVVAVLRSIADVQRAGHLLRHVGESLAWVHPPSMPEHLRDLIGQLSFVAGMVFAGAVGAWRDQDALAAVELQQLDDEADRLQKLLLTQLYLGGQTVEEAVSLALICRYYERIADHGVEIARQVAFSLTGDRPRPVADER